MNDKITLLKEKLDKSKINYTELILSEENTASKVKFEIPAGREKHECIISYNEKQLDFALNTNFEEFRFIFSYEAIWSKENNIIEGAISSSSFSSSSFFIRLYKYIMKPEELENEEEEEEENKEIIFPQFNNIEISIGYCSPEFTLLSGARERGMSRLSSRRITIKIKNANKNTHDSAKDTLEKIANSLFFQIDLAFELSINLESQRETFIERYLKRTRKSRFIDKSAIISEPKYEYDQEAISLYWYAKESLNMPIFQFLAYYQSIEFYFPIYSSYEAKQKIQGIIKDPRFNPNRDADITRIISSVRSSANGKGFGNEREQLKATISNCTNNLELRSFLEAEKNRKLFFEENKGKGLSPQKISLKIENVDIVSEVCERIYQIRCRIVHSKASENEYEVLLPYSNDVKNLNFDIDLIEFISRKVLINSSRPINI